jgi:hypothetical protein
VLEGANIALPIVVWALFISPNPTIELGRPLRLALGFAVWTAAGAALYASGHPRLALAVVGVAMVSGSLNYRWS